MARRPGSDKRRSRSSALSGEILSSRSDKPPADVASAKRSPHKIAAWRLALAIGAALIAALAFAHFLFWAKPCHNAPSRLSIASPDWWLCYRENDPTLRLPRVPSVALLDADFADENHGWVVGEHGVILHTPDGGETWELQSPPAILANRTDLDFRGVDFITPDEGWAVGDDTPPGISLWGDNVILHTTDGGQNWELQEIVAIPLESPFAPDESAALFGASRYLVAQLNDEAASESADKSGEEFLPSIESTPSLTDVRFTDRNNGWAVGSNGTILSYDRKSRKWTRNLSIGGEAVDFVAIDMIDSQHGWIIDNRGQVFHMGDGKTWTLVTPDDSKQAAQQLPLDIGISRVQFLDESNGWAVGWKGVARTTDGGRSWIQTAAPDGLDVVINLCFLNAETGWILGRSSIDSSSRREYSLWKTTDGGNTWKRHAGTGLLTTCLTRIPQRNTLLFAGEVGSIWTLGDDESASPRSASSGRIYCDVDFLNAESGWVVKFDGSILHTADGGETWRKRSAQICRSLSFIDELRGWAFEPYGSLAKTADGGRTWTRLPSPGPNSVFDFPKIKFINQGLGWLFGSLSGLRQTTDGGTTWQVVHGPLNAVNDRDVNRYCRCTLNPDGSLRSLSGLAADGKLFQLNAGETEWKHIGQVREEVTSLLNHIHVQQPELREVDVRGRLVTSADDGVTWTPMSTGVDEAFLSVDFVDDQHGWAVGVNDTLLRTVDGGQTWQDPRRHRAAPPPLFCALLSLSAVMLVAAGARRAPSPAPEEFIDGLLAAERPVGAADNDALKLQPIADGLANYLRNASTQAPVTIAVTGPWGSGKSSLMNLLRERMIELRSRPVWFNAWHHQSEQDLLASLLESIRSTAAPPFFSATGLRFRLRLAARRIYHNRGRVLAFLAIAAFLIMFIHQLQLWQKLVDLLNANDFQASTQTILGGTGVLGTLYLLVTRLLVPLTSTLGVDPAVLLSTKAQSSRLQNLRDQTSFRYQFAAEFKIMTESLKPQTLLIFIDDLDRCEPDSLMNLLQVLNFLTTSGDCFFVLGMDYQRVEDNVAMARAQQVKDIKIAAQESSEQFAKNYLQKLIQVRVPVPHMGESEARQLIQAAGQQRDLELEPESQDARQTRVRRAMARTAARALTLVRSPYFSYPLLATVLVCAALWAGERASRIVHPAAPRDAAVKAFNVRGSVLGLPVSLHVEESGGAAARAAQPTGGARATTTLPKSVSPPAATTPNAAESAETPPAAPSRAYTREVLARSSNVDWKWAAVALGVIGLGVTVALRRVDEAYIVRDSKLFYEAVFRWLPALAPSGNEPPATPRSIKRFLNRVRLYAMLSRGHDAGVSRDPENVLVGLGAIAHLDMEDLLQEVLIGKGSWNAPGLPAEVQRAAEDVSKYLQKNWARQPYFRYLVELGR